MLLRILNLILKYWNQVEIEQYEIELVGLHHTYVDHRYTLLAKHGKRGCFMTPEDAFFWAIKNC